MPVEPAFLGGVILTVATAATNALAFTFQKIGHHRAAAVSAAPAAATESTSFGPSVVSTQKPKNVTRQPFWLLGIACVLFAAIGSAVVFSLVGQSTASALQVQAVAYAAVLSGTVLREPFSWVDALVTLLIIAGAATSAVSASAAGGVKLSFDDGLALLARPASYLTAACVAVVGGAGFVFIVYANRMRAIAPDPAATLGSPKDALRAAELAVRALLASTFAALSGLSAKILMLGIASSIARSSSDCLRAWQWWLSVVGIAVSFASQMTWLNTALAVFPSLEVIPLYQAAATSFGIASGFVFLNEAAYLPTRALATFGLGAALSVAGVSLLLVKRLLLRACPSLGVERALRRAVAPLLGPSWLPVEAAAAPPHTAAAGGLGERDGDRLLSPSSAAPAWSGGAASGGLSRPTSHSIVSIESRRSAAVPLRKETSRARFASFALGGTLKREFSTSMAGVHEAAGVARGGGGIPRRVSMAQGVSDHGGGGTSGNSWPARVLESATATAIDAAILANYAARASFVGFLGLPDAEFDAALDGLEGVAEGEEEAAALAEAGQGMGPGGRRRIPTG